MQSPTAVSLFSVYDKTKHGGNMNNTAEDRDAEEGMVDNAAYNHVGLGRLQSSPGADDHHHHNEMGTIANCGDSGDVYKPGSIGDRENASLEDSLTDNAVYNGTHLLFNHVATSLSNEYQFDTPANNIALPESNSTHPTENYVHE